MPYFKVCITNSFHSPDEDIAESRTTKTYYGMEAEDEKIVANFANRLKGREVEYRQYLGVGQIVEVSKEEFDKIPLFIEAWPSVVF